MNKIDPSNQPGGEVLADLDTSSQWSFEVAWCPRNPGVVAGSSFDGKISVYSLMGGQQQARLLFNLAMIEISD
jgi:protein transport protein SEC31